MLSKRAMFFCTFVLLIAFGTTPVFAHMNRGHSSNFHVQKTFKISSIGKEGLRIREPGVYIFENNIEIQKLKGDTAILIESDNVCLEFNCHTLSQSAKKKDIIAINVKRNLNNISIRNGTIRDFGAYGLLVDAGNKNIEVLGMNFINNGSRYTIVPYPDGDLLSGAVAFVGKPEAPIKDVFFANSNIEHTKSKRPDVRLAALSIICTFNAIVQNSNCIFTDAQSELGSYGLFAYKTNNTTLENCNFDHTSNNPKKNGENSEVAGAYFESSDQPHENPIIKNCTFNNTNGRVACVTGLYLDFVNNLVVENCEMNSSLTKLEDGEKIFPTDFPGAVGLSLGWVGQFVINQVNASHNSSEHPTQRTVAGILLATSQDGVISNCSMSNNSNSGGTGIGAGLATAFSSCDSLQDPLCPPPQVSNVVITNCTAQNNQTGVGNGAGFRFEGGNTLHVLDSNAQNNQGHGFYATGSTSDDSKTQNSIFLNNISNANSLVGFKDDSGSESLDLGRLVNVFGNNVGKLNAVQNFDLPSSSQVRTWNASFGAPPTLTTLFENISIE